MTGHLLAAGQAFRGNRRQLVPRTKVRQVVQVKRSRYGGIAFAAIVHSPGQVRPKPTDTTPFGFPTAVAFAACLNNQRIQLPAGYGLAVCAVQPAGATAAFGTMIQIPDLGLPFVKVQRPNLTLGSIDRKRRQIMVQQGKGGKDRVVYISEDALEALNAYLKFRSHYRTKNVFLVEKGTYKGKAISVRGIQKRIEHYAKKTRINVSCHRLRHTMATQLLNAEAEVETIQDLLGHNWITTTQRYCKVSNLKVQRDYFKAMRTVLQRFDQPSSTHLFDPG